MSAVRGKSKLVVLGMMSKMPVAGVVWQTAHYLVGFERLGYEVYYVEAHGCTARAFMNSETDDGSANAAKFIDTVMRRFGLGDRWAYHAIYDDNRIFGKSHAQLRELYNSVELIINLHGGTEPREELARGGKLIYLGTDPVEVELNVFHKDKVTIDFLKPHAAFFTYGENHGRPDCKLPWSDQFPFRPTRQPVIMDYWDDTPPTGGNVFTTIGNWKQPYREVKFKGQVYTWSKHHEFMKVIDLPARTGAAFELALSAYEPADKAMLEQRGWRVRHGLDVSTDIDVYKQYISDARGEFTVAKDQNIRLRTGWFSDRAATFLAAGRPVITQETGFCNILPTGEGLLGFSTLDEAIAAVAKVNSDYPRHCRAARDIARSHFAHDVVLGQMLADLGVTA